MTSFDVVSTECLAGSPVPGFQFSSLRIAKRQPAATGLELPNAFHRKRNYNSGGVVAEESGKDARTARITLYYDAAHPSFLVIPVVR